MAPHLLDIAEVALASGLAPSALRFYERKGLIRSVDRNGLRRRFDPGVLDELAVILAAQETGFSLAEIKLLLRAAHRSDADVRGLLGAKADAIDAEIDRLSVIRDQLRHAADCAAPRLLDCATFRSCLKSALPRRHDPNPIPSHQQSRRSAPR
jgi:DNA-binding transcriptional MerR regulator